MAHHSDSLGERMATLVKEIEETTKNHSLEVSAQALREQLLRDKILSNVKLFIAVQEGLHERYFYMYDPIPGPRIAVLPSNQDSTLLTASVVATQYIPPHNRQGARIKSYVTFVSGGESESEMLALQSLYEATQVSLAGAVQEAKEVDLRREMKNGGFVC